MTVLRTPDERFNNLPDFPFSPHYVEVEDADLGALRIHYVDEGPDDAPVVFCLHGEPTWSFLYRKMIPHFVAAGFRVIAPDLVGFGRSDKPAKREDYTYARHVRWMRQLIEALDLRNMTLVGQDWGGLIGLRLATELDERFSAITVSNTGLPTGDQAMGEAFEKWQRWSQEDETFDIGFIVNLFGRGDLADEVVEAYRAPFPSDEYKAGARQFPSLVPTRPDDPASDANRKAWLALTHWQKPMLVCFSDSDPVTAGADAPFLKLVPGTRGQPHTTLSGHHFIQEEDGERWAAVIIDWLKAA